MPRYPVSPPELDKLANEFAYHLAEADQPERYASNRAACHDAALAIMTNCPPSAERTVALRKLREAMFYANAAIAVNEAKEPANLLGGPAPPASSVRLAGDLTEALGDKALRVPEKMDATEARAEQHPPAAYEPLESMSEKADRLKRKGQGPGGEPPAGGKGGG